jgi:hypothetical protein
MLRNRREEFLDRARTDACPLAGLHLRGGEGEQSDLPRPTPTSGQDPVCATVEAWLPGAY